MAAIIVVGLLLGGFAFPPLWLGLVGYVYYLSKTGKQRRSDIIQRQLEKMIQSRKMQATVTNLYFEAARAFAQDNGGHIFDEDRNVINCTTLIEGTPYSVTFMRDSKAGTYIQIADKVYLDDSSPESLRDSMKSLF